MVDPSARARVALPRIPPWTAPTPAAVAKAAEAQKRREEGKKDGGAAADAVTGKDKEKQKENGTAGAAGGAAAVNGNGGGSAGEKKGGSVTGRELEGLVGARIRVTNILNNTFTGSIYTCSSSSSAPELVLSTGSTEYHLIPVSKIRSYEILEQPGKGQGQNSEQAMVSQKQKQISEERERKLQKPAGVSDVGHALFLVLEKTLPVHWNDKKIVVLDNVTIEPPYDADDCKAAPKHAKQLERVKDLVRREREKVAGRRGG